MPAIGRPGKPKSLVDHLNDQAPKRPVNESVSINRYLWSAELLLSQATQYRLIDDEEQLYVILLRYASLVVETIPKHRDFSASNPTYATLKRDLLERYLPELERLKAGLKLKDRSEPPAAASRNRPADAVQLSQSNLPQLNWASSGAPPPPPVAASAEAPRNLQVDDLLEVMRGAPAGGPPAGTQRGEAQPPGGAASRSVGGGVPGGPTDPYALAAAASASLAGANALVQVPQPKYQHCYASTSGRHSLFGQPGGRSADGQRLSPGTSALGLPRYPALEAAPAGSPPGPVAPSSAAAAADIAQLSIAPNLDLAALMAPHIHPSAGPSLGPQEVAVLHLAASTHGLPDTCSVAHGAPPSAPALPAPPEPSAPAAAAPGGPKELVKRAQLRDVHVSVALMEEFLKYARSNTSRGIESCGILAGKLLAGDSTFAITTLIIPKQQGTTDTVQALNEEEIFEAQFARELYPMGWIHTHPTQTCFLSSVDVHTQCGYQTMLDEAVAIVMAPTDSSKRCGIFRLSTPGGLSLVQKCPNRGFHMHPPTDTGQELYELCGHVYLNPRTSYEVLDLR